MRRRTCLALAGLAGLPALLVACGRKKPPMGSALGAGSRVLALGDSLTYGTGAEAGADYPALLAQLSGWSVVNGGMPGDTAAQALERLPALLAGNPPPALVIVSAGGNDFLRRLPEADTAAALRQTVTLARAAGAQVVLVAVPQPSISAMIGAKASASLGDHPLYARLAEELSVPMHAGGWARVLGDDRLKSDAIHANAAGYRAFAESLAATLRDQGFLKTN